MSNEDICKILLQTWAVESEERGKFRFNPIPDPCLSPC